MSEYIILDIEMCKVSRKKGIRHEIIQIGAVHMDKDYNIIDMFNTYVCPQIGCLDNFITKLTGIRKNDISNAPVLKDALDLFYEWLPKDGVTFVTWSENDELQLKKECRLKEIDFTKFDVLVEKWLDSQKLFTTKIKGNKVYNLSEALNLSDIIFEGREHNGLDDAYNTALLFKKLQTEEELVLNPYYQKAREEDNDDLSFSLGSLFLNLGI